MHATQLRLTLALDLIRFLFSRPLLLKSSSQALQAPKLLQSTARTIERERSAKNMLFTASTAIQACVLNTVEGCGKSKMFRTRARIHAWPTLQAGARWRTAPRACGALGLEKGGAINRA